jgi:hypothetical protein
VVEKVLEEKIYEWINSVLDVAAKDPEVMKTLRETFAAHEELIQPMFRWRYACRQRLERAAQSGCVRHRLHSPCGHDVLRAVRQQVYRDNVLLY